MEPFLQNMNLLGREKFINYYGDYEYKKGICPIAEGLQGKMLQFKTNYWNEGVIEQKADALKKTIDYFNRVK